MAIQGATNEQTRIRAKIPKRYQVVMYNDDFTPMDFVVEILMDIFQKPEGEAVALMYEVHLGGSAVVGTYSYDIAHTKASLAITRAREQGWPFQVRVEKE